MSEPAGRTETDGHASSPGAAGPASGAQRGGASPGRDAPDAPDLTGPQRLHPAALLLWPLPRLLPIVLIVVAGEGGGAGTGGASLAIFGALALLAVVGSGVRWWRFTWRLEGDALVIEQGLLQRSRRVVPRDRIQSVDLVRKVRQRLLGVVEVRVETVGSGTEARLEALSVRTAQGLRAQLLQGPVHGTHEPGAGPAALALSDLGRGLQGEELARLSRGRVVLAGLTGGRVGVVLALVAGAQELFGDRFFAAVGRLPAALGPVGLVVTAVLGAVAVFVLSVGATALAYWDHTLVRDGDQVRVRRGLLEERLETAPLRRVQILTVEENLLRRVFGLAAVKASVAGRGGAGSGGGDVGMLLPLAATTDAHRLVAGLLGAEELASVRLEGMPRRALYRRLGRTAMVTVAAVVAGVLTLGWAGLWFVAVGIPSAALAVDSWRNLGWQRHGDHVVAREGTIVRSTSYVPLERMQGVEVSANPFQRRVGLAHLVLLVADAGRLPDDSRLRDLDAGVAADLQRHLGTEVLARLPRLRRSVVGEGFEPSKAEPADLQSAPFGRSGIPPGASW